MLADGQAWDTVEKAIKATDENNRQRSYLVFPEFQNELACRVWSRHAKPINDRFYDKNCDFAIRVNRLPPMSTITRKVRDKEFAEDNTVLAQMMKAILAEHPCLIPPSRGHDEEWLYQNEFVIRVWAACWALYDKQGVTLPVYKKTYPWRPAEYGNVFAAFLSEDKAHHWMKHEMLKVMTIERDRRHIQESGIYTKEIVVKTQGMATLTEFT